MQAQAPCRATSRGDNSPAAALGLGRRVAVKEREIILMCNVVHPAPELGQTMWHGLGAWMLFHTIPSKEAVPGKAWLPEKPRKYLGRVWYVFWS